MPSFSSEFDSLPRLNPSPAPPAAPSMPEIHIGVPSVPKWQLEEAQLHVGSALAPLWPWLVLIAVTSLAITALTALLQRRAELVLRNSQDFGHRPKRKRKHRHHRSSRPRTSSLLLA